MSGCSRVGPATSSVGTGRTRSLLAAWLLITLGACAGGETALARGDRLWADSNFTGALAEYRLSLEQSGGDATVLARVAHAYAVVGQFERAREAYADLLRRAPEYTDQAVFDYLQLARRAMERSDRYGMAGAAGAALELRPGLPLGEMNGALARYHATTGDIDRAVEFYERALTTARPDSTADLLFELAEIQESRGACGEAIELFGAYRSRVQRGERREQAGYHVASCSYTLALQARQAGEQERALELLGTVLELGVPANLQDEAWFERGEALFSLGRYPQALDAYYQVLERAPAGRGPLAERAQQRIDDIRFGRVPLPTLTEPDPGPPGT